MLLLLVLPCYSLRHPFVPAARKLSYNLSELGIRAAQWTNLSWDTEYFTSALCVYIPKGQHKAYWNEFDQNSLGQTQSPAYWH